MASNMARRIQVAIIERSAAICPALYGMNRTPGDDRDRIHPRTEKGAARWAWMYSKAAMADTGTDRIEPNMRALSGSRKGCAGDPARIGRSSSVEATASNLHRFERSRQPQTWHRRTTALKN